MLYLWWCLYNSLHFHVGHNLLFVVGCRRLGTPDIQNMGKMWYYWDTTGLCCVWSCAACSDKPLRINPYTIAFTNYGLESHLVCPGVTDMHQQSSQPTTTLSLSFKCDVPLSPSFTYQKRVVWPLTRKQQKPELQARVLPLLSKVSSHIPSYSNGIIQNSQKKYFCVSVISIFNVKRSQCNPCYFCMSHSSKNGSAMLCSKNFLWHLYYVECRCLCMSMTLVLFCILVLFGTFLFLTLMCKWKLLSWAERKWNVIFENILIIATYICNASGSAHCYNIFSNTVRLT